MMTLRQIERHWNAKAYDRLARELLAGRPEASLRLEMELSSAVPVAALALIRLDELGHSHAPLCAALIRHLVGAQQSDGGWGDLMVTALCVRALLCDGGRGSAIHNGMQYIALLQKSEGIWPAIPLRRTSADAYVSAFILYQLGEFAAFRAMVRFDDALRWFDQHKSLGDEQTTHLWQRAMFKCHLTIEPALNWS